MAKYDDASWHYGGDYPKNLPDENGATHIGMFITWCIENNLISNSLIEECAADIEKIKKHQITGADFLIDNCDEKFLDEDLNELGNEFARDYYEDDTSFGNEFGYYTNDYAATFDKKAEQSGFEYESIYHVENTFENYEILKPIIDKRFEEWKIYINK